MRFLMVTVYAKILLRELIRLFVRVLWFLPVRKNRIVFESFQGRQFADNPREIWRYMRAHYGDRFDYVCSLTDPASLTEREGIRAVRYKSWQWLYCQLTAGVIVSNTLPITILPKRKGQQFIETWHGGGAYKTLADDFLGYSRAKRTMIRWNNTLLCRKIDVFLSSSGRFSEVGIIQPYGYTKNICFTGMPRNDIFFDAGRVSAASRKVRERYHLRGTVILYAPTWRGTDFQNTKRIDTLLDFARLQSAIPDASILFRSHYADHNRYDSFDRVTDVKDYPDMQELLCAADILITDYSSSIWDYALLGRPCLLYVPDLEEYEKVEHGFCTPIETWPGVVCKNMDALCEAAASIDPAEHKARAEAHLRALGSYENGSACRQVADMILDHCRS